LLGLTADEGDLCGGSQGRESAARCVKTPQHGGVARGTSEERGNGETAAEPQHGAYVGQ
jgi:hypothetical protein